MDPVGSKKVYFNKNLAPKVDRFSAEELSVLVEEGRGLFELAMSEATEVEIAYLESHPNLKKFVGKW